MTVIRKAPMYVLHRGSGGRVDRFRGDVGALVWHPDRPEAVQLVSCLDPVDVTVDGASLALISDFDEPSGGVTMWPTLCTAGREWWIADVNTRDLNVQFTIAADVVASFLTDVARTRRMTGVRAGVGDREWDLPFRHVEGGA